MIYKQLWNCGVWATGARVEGDIGKKRDPFGEKLPLQYVHLLGGSSVTLSRLQEELDDLKDKVIMYAPFGIALLIALILNLLKVNRRNHGVE